jgi:PKHD-type hydroxylase
MLLQIPKLLTSEQVAQCRRIIDGAEWADGRETAGYQAARVKNNAQLKKDSPAIRDAGTIVMSALSGNDLFKSAARPQKVYPPNFNRYSAGQAYGVHFDTAIIRVPGTPLSLRADLSATVFLNDPGEYDGGELVIDDMYRPHEVKLSSGDMILYPAGSLHHVRPVTRGERIASFFWIQSTVRDNGERLLLFELESVIDRIAPVVADHGAVMQLTSIYQNLLRRWTSL